MNHSKQILWHIILISLMNAMTYIYAEFSFIWLHTPLFCKILFAIIYGTLQLSLLFHTIKASSKLIYFFPFYWLLGIFRILYRAFSRESVFPVLIKKLFDLSTPLWYGGFFPGTLLPELAIEKYPYYISYETIIKLLIAFSAFIFSSYAAIQKYNLEKGAVKKHSL